MHYLPFRFSEHPKLMCAIQDYPFDIFTARTYKNIRYYNNELQFSYVVSGEITDYTIPLDDEHIDFSSKSPNFLCALNAILKGLNDADEISLKQLEMPLATQYAVMNTFRAFHPMYGGRRYVALCRDLIDANMGKCLHPYMYEDLVTSMFLNFNKSIGKDIDGLLSGIIEYLEELHLDEEGLRRFYACVGAKTTPLVYRNFALKILDSAKLSASMRHMIVATLSLVQFNSKEIRPEIPMSIVATFPKEDLALILKNIPGGMKNVLKELFLAFGEHIDEDLINAYLENPYRDLGLLADAPFFNDLPPALKSKIYRGKIFTTNSSALEIIRYFTSLEDEEERSNLIRACFDMGKTDLARAFTGQDFSLLPFKIKEIHALLPFANFANETMQRRLCSYLQHYVDYHQVSPELDEILMSMKGNAYISLLTEAVLRNAFYSPAKRLQVADQYGLIGQLGLKEWKYHD